MSPSAAVPIGCFADFGPRLDWASDQSLLFVVNRDDPADRSFGNRSGDVARCCELLWEHQHQRREENEPDTKEEVTTDRAFDPVARDWEREDKHPDRPDHVEDPKLHAVSLCVPRENTLVRLTPRRSAETDRG